MSNENRTETQALPKAVRYVGADDLTLPLFENQYPVQPMGVSYLFTVLRCCRPVA